MLPTSYVGYAVTSNTTRHRKTIRHLAGSRQTQAPPLHRSHSLVTLAFKFQHKTQTLNLSLLRLVDYFLSHNGTGYAIVNELTTYRH